MKLTQTLFEWVLTSAFLILAVLALRALLGRRVSAGLRYALWAVVLVRLLVPVQLFTTPVAGTSVLRETGVEQWVSPPDLQPDPVPAVSAAPVPAPTELPGGTVIVYQPATPPVTVTAEPLPVLQALGWLWLAGSAGAAAAFLISNLTFARRLGRVRRPLEGADCPLPVYIADSLPSPCLFGLFRPAVYVTEDAAQSPAMLRHVLAHEYTHFRHGDHVWNVLRSAALILHWWNPLVWLAAVLSRRDGELACDEGALKRLGDGERIAYGRTLVALITARPRPGDLFRCATTMTGGQKSVFDRVTRIAKAPKRWLWAAVAAVAVTVLACVCAFGRAEERDAPPAAGVTADLTFSLETSSDGKPYVRMDGTVDGVELTRGAFWYPDWWQGDQMTPELTMVYPPFTDGIEGLIHVNWEGGPGSEVTISTQPTALFSSQSNIGYWVFTVNLDTGTVQKQQMPLDSQVEGETRFYPRSISDEEAVRAARIAAKLLTAGEDYYNNYNSGAEIPQLYADVLKGGEFYSVSLEEWTRTTLDKLLREEKEAGYMAPGFEVSGYTLVDLDGDGQDELILWIGQEGVGESYLIFHQLDGKLCSYFCAYKSMKDLKTDGTFFDQYLFSEEWDRQGLGYSRISFTETGLEFHPFTYSVSLPGDLPEDEKYVYVVDGKTVDAESYSAAVEAQDAKPAPMWHELSLKDLDAPAPTHPLLSGLTFTLREEEARVMIDGGKTIYTWWHVPDETTSLGYLSFANPETDGKWLGGVAEWTGEDRTAISLVLIAARMQFSYTVRTEPDVDVAEAVISSHIAYQDEGDTVPVAEEEAVEMARLFAGYIRAAESFFEEWAAKRGPSTPAAPVTYTLDEYGVSLAITGLDCESAYWHSKANCYTPISETAVGELSISKPRFLGGVFADTYSAVTAQYSPEEGGRLWMDVTEKIETGTGLLGSRQFMVDLATGAVTEQEIFIPEWKGKLPAPSDEVLLRAAQTLVQLIQGASNFYTASLPAPEEGPLPFDTPMKLMFCSGAGAWDTLLTLHPDGSFEGDFHDTDAGDSGDGYQSTEYVCRFHGRFGDIRQVTNASWSLTLAELVLDTGHPIGEEWIETIATPEGSYNQRYISSGPYGFDTADGEPLEPGAPFMLYTPEARGYRPTDELYGMRESEDYDSVMFQFWTWWPGKGAWAPDGALNCYGLCSMETGRGFFDLKAWGIA